VGCFGRWAEFGGVGGWAPLSVIFDVAGTVSSVPCRVVASGRPLPVRLPSSCVVVEEVRNDSIGSFAAIPDSVFF
jgi:hypothetical protein